jgi:hypothetical protein
VGEAGRLLHYDGTSWSSVESGTTADLYAVWGTAHSDVFTVGYHSTSPLHGTIQHYDGASWSSMESGTEYALANVWGNSASDVFVVGDYGTILHYLGP